MKETGIRAEWSVADWEALPREPLSTSSGRGMVQLVHHPRGAVIERRYRHGGLRRHLLPEHFWRNARPMREFEAHQAAFSAGVATAEPVGWRARPALLPFYKRFCYYSVFLPDAVLLSSAFARATVKRSHLQEMARTLVALHGLGMFHGDLNLNNWLLSSDKVYLIDFDKACPAPSNKTVYLVACLHRMARSGRKLGFLAYRRQFYRFILIASAEFGVNAREVASVLPLQLQTITWWDRLRWRLSGGHRQPPP